MAIKIIILLIVLALSILLIKVFFRLSEGYDRDFEDLNKEPNIENPPPGSIFIKLFLRTTALLLLIFYLYCLGNIALMLLEEILVEGGFYYFRVI